MVGCARRGGDQLREETWFLGDGEIGRLGDDVEIGRLGDDVETGRLGDDVEIGRRDEREKAKHAKNVVD